MANPWLLDIANSVLRPILSGIGVALRGTNGQEVRLKSPASPTTYSLVYPSTLPTSANQNLVADASGNQSWFGPQNSLNEFAAWSVITSHPSSPTNNLASMFSNSSKIELVPAFDVSAVVLAFENRVAGSTGEQPNTNPIRVRASLQPTNSTLVAGVNDTADLAGSLRHLIFGGRDHCVIPGGMMAMSNPMRVGLKANTRSWYRVTADVVTGIPTAPSLAGSTSGGTIAAGTYVVGYTLVWPDGSETVGSTATSVTTTGSTSSITVTAPTQSTAIASWSGVVGYRVWMSQVGFTTPLYQTASGKVPFGTNYVITAATTLSASTSGSIKRVTNGIDANLIIGDYSAGGTNIRGWANNGEYAYTNSDYCGEGAIGTSITGNRIYGPTFALGLDPNKIHASIAGIGDSITTGFGDAGYCYNSRGGWLARLASNHQSTRYYDVTRSPFCGYMNLATFGETALSFSNTTGNQRTTDALFATTISIGYGTNDLNAGSTGAATLLGYYSIILTRFQNVTPVPRNYLIPTLLPRTSSTDGWRTVSNQTPGSAQVTFEGCRRQWNNFLRSSGAQQTITNEALLGCYTIAGITPSTNLFAGGDGSTTKFTAANLFVQGTETVKVNGVTKVLTTDYTYLFTATVGGVNYASGFTFVSAPGNGLSVIASYTSIAGLTTIFGSRVALAEIAAPCEVDANNAQALNGGWWKSVSTKLVNSTLTSTGSNAINDTNQAWSTDQYRGYLVRIDVDGTTPSSVGQVKTIIGNTSTVALLDSSWSVSPSSGATYSIYDGYSTDGVHQSAAASMASAQNVSQSLIVAS